MIRRTWAAAVVGAALLANSASGAGSQGAAFRWFEPEATVSRDDLQRLDRGEVIVKPLPSTSGQLGVFATTRLDASPDLFVEWIREIEQLKRSKAVPAGRRFSEPPVLSDLDGLVLDQRDVDAIRECRVGQCALKLTVAEIQSLRRVADQGRVELIQDAFRRMLFARLEAYRAGGLAAFPAPAGRADASRPTDVFAALRVSSPYIPRSDLRLASWLEGPERTAGAGVESFYYWSKEYYAAGKPVMILTHVGVTRSPRGSASPEVAVVGKQVFATRYMNGMLTHITLVRDPESGSLYMTYTNRAQLDMLKGMLGGLVRTIVNGRLKGDASTVLRTLRVRIESGPPSRAGLD